jgi:AcrR family transcriptional regulator
VSPSGPVSTAGPARANEAQVLTVAKGGRPRSTAADQALLHAALESLEEDGYARLSMAGVAKRAGVSGTTLYRRWSSKEDLVIAALESLHQGVDYLDTGSLAGDLDKALRQTADAFRGEQGRVLRGLIGELFKNPELVALVQDRLGGAKRQLFVDMIERAVRRGEIPPIDPSIALNLVLGPVFHRFMLDSETLTAAVVDYLVPMIMAALKAAPPEHWPGRNGRESIRGGVARR